MDDLQTLEEALHQAALDLGWLKRIAELTLEDDDDVVALGVPSYMDEPLAALREYWPKCCENRDRAWRLLHPVRQWIAQPEPVVLGGESAASWCELTVQARALAIVNTIPSRVFDDRWRDTAYGYASNVAEALSEFDESLFIGWISIEVREARRRMVAEGVKPVFWSPFLSSQDWVKRLELSETSFRRKCENQQFIKHPDSSRGDGISLLLSSLPEDKRS